MHIQTIEGGRAAYAYKLALDAARDENVKDSEYRSIVKKIPMYIKTNGLGATFAFVLAKSTGSGSQAQSFKLLHQQVLVWMKKNERSYLLRDVKGNSLTGGNDFAQILIKLPSSTYRAVTMEILALFTWLRRYAEGLLEDQTGSNNQEVEDATQEGA